MPDERGLAGAVGADEAVDRPARDVRLTAASAVLAPKRRRSPGRGTPTHVPSSAASRSPGERMVSAIHSPPRAAANGFRRLDRRCFGPIER